MQRDTNDFTRRGFLTAGALGACAAIAPAVVDAAEPTADEKANVKIVKHFCSTTICRIRRLFDLRRSEA